MEIPLELSPSNSLDNGYVLCYIEGDTMSGWHNR